MLPTFLFQIFTVTADFFMFLFFGYYFWKFHGREKEIEKKEEKIDTDYHRVVDNALTKERKILEDATSEADKIISDAKYVTDASRQNIDTTLKNTATNFERETTATAQEFMTNYKNSLQELSAGSLNDFKTITAELEKSLQKQLADFNRTILPNMEKQLEDYKKSRLAHIDQVVVKITQKVAQEVLNKSLSLEDHQKLMNETLERAKKEGIFD